MTFYRLHDSGYRAEVYRLPTRAARKYRGKYPNRVHSFSGRAGTYHVELNNGMRYVVNGSAITTYAKRSPIRNIYGRDFWNGLLYPGTLEVIMYEGDYAAILFMCRVIRLFNGSN